MNSLDVARKVTESGGAIKAVAQAVAHLKAVAQTKKGGIIALPNDLPTVPRQSADADFGPAHFKFQGRSYSLSKRSVRGKAPTRDDPYYIRFEHEKRAHMLSLKTNNRAVAESRAKTSIAKVTGKKWVDVDKLKARQSAATYGEIKRTYPTIARIAAMSIRNNLYEMCKVLKLGLGTDKVDEVSLNDVNGMLAVNFQNAYVRDVCNTSDPSPAVQRQAREQALRRELASLLNWQDQRQADIERKKIQAAYEILKNLTPARHSLGEGGCFSDLNQRQQDFVIREFCAVKVAEYSQGIGEVRGYPFPLKSLKGGTLEPGEPAAPISAPSDPSHPSDPSSVHLEPVEGGATEPCPDCSGRGGVTSASLTSQNRRTCLTCGGRGALPLPHRGGTAFVPKMATALTLVAEILERKEQALVFSAFNDPLDNLAEWLREAGVRHCLLDGRTSQKLRGQKAALFKRGRMSDSSDPSAPSEALTYPIMLAGIECLAEGHSFHLANNVILVAYSWAYDKFKQALDRVHRMNSVKPVNLYVVLCPGSIDRKLEALVQEKGDAAELVLDGRLIGERTEEINLAELLKVARREFNAKDNTLDEALLQAEWPHLRTRLAAAMRQWDADSQTLGDTANPATAKVAPEFLATQTTMPPSKPFTRDKVIPMPSRDTAHAVNWKVRLKKRTCRLL